MAEIKELLKQSIVAQAKQASTISQLLAHNKILDTQISQLASSSSNTEKAPHEMLNVITLRSVSNYDGSKMPSTTDIYETELARSNFKGSTEKWAETEATEHSDRSLDRGRVSSIEQSHARSSDHVLNRAPSTAETKHIHVSDPKVHDVSITIKLPFPNRNRKAKVDSQFREIYEGR
ncbi:hypothetical protein vseg_013471 [Gypsophila vaccaria]